jgi:uncharacterized BrkB/YihY/UPF0761 family membrane protein
MGRHGREAVLGGYSATMTDEYPTSHRPTATSVAAPRVADVVATVILIVLGLFGVGVLAFVSLFLSMASDGCGNGGCDLTVFSVAWLAALLLPPVVYLVAVGWSVIRMARRRSSWWVPIAGAAAALAVWVVAYVVLVSTVS